MQEFETFDLFSRAPNGKFYIICYYTVVQVLANSVAITLGCILKHSVAAL